MFQLAFDFVAKLAMDMKGCSNPQGLALFVRSAIQITLLILSADIMPDGV